MQFLPIFLDLQTGPVVLVGAGELAAAKLRVLTSAGARVRWHATSRASALSGLEPQIAARVTLEAGDPLTAETQARMQNWLVGHPQDWFAPNAYTLVDLEADRPAGVVPAEVLAVLRRS